MKSREQQARIWAKIVARAWEDEAFKKELLKNPEKILEEYEIHHMGKKCKILENTDDLYFLVLPRKTGAMSVHELSKIAAANFQIYDF